jgi:hypothetical protein
MLFRVLDCVNLLQNNNWKEKELLSFLEEKASLMLGWLENITFRNGNIPLLNDSSNCIAPTSNELFSYANNLKLNIQNSKLSQSGYRKITKENYECIVDVGEVGASYIPGHAHADAFNFEVYIQNQPFIVDTGLSTYNTGKRRDIERSTKSHNTVEINGENSSEVWGGFRVGNRANIVNVVENIDHIKATHDGYRKKFGILHTREWQFEEERIIIKESLNKSASAVARVHFHPDVTESMVKKHITIINNASQIHHYLYASEFNKHRKAIMLEMLFTQKVEMEITL